MQLKEFDGMTCSMALVMGALVDRWGALIMRDLILGLRRYDDLKRSTEATHATLSDRLKKLEANGLVERRQYQSRPDRYEYVPTRMGRDIGLVIHAMAQVGDKWNLAGLEGPPLRFVDRHSGHAVKLALVDTTTGMRIAGRDLRIEPGPGADAAMRLRLKSRGIEGKDGNEGENAGE
jgi:DNA-binding HxlR family transcriptional regulator